MVMRLWQRPGADEAQASGHPEMHYERTVFESDEQVFRAPIDCNDTSAANGRFEFRGNGPAQTPIAHDHVDDARANKRGSDAASGRFYFRELWHRCAEANRLEHLAEGEVVLFDLRFFVGDVLAHHGIEFLRLELVRMQALIFGGRVVVTGAGGGNQFDLVAHDGPLNLDAFGSQIRDHHVHAALLNGPQSAGGYAQAYETLLGFRPKSVAMQIGQKAAALAIVRMRNRVTRFGAFARDLANSRHG